MVPRAGLEPARYCYRGILSPLCLPIPPLRQLISIDGGDTRIRTGDNDFADHCLTTWRCRPLKNGANDRARTDNLLVGNEMLYH